MDTPKPRFSVSIDAELYEKITDYQHGKKLKSQTQAIAEILKIGIDAVLEEDGVKPIKPEPKFSDQLAQIIDIYNSMNQTGQQLLALQAELLSHEPKYKKNLLIYPPNL